MIVGDQVRLRGGGQVMRVAKIADGIVTLKWKREGARRRAVFRVGVLEYLRVKI